MKQKMLYEYTLKQLLVEEAIIDNYDALTPEEILDLKFMEHDKGHIDIENSTAIAKAFEYYSQTSPAPLYRGIYDIEKSRLSNMNTGEIFQFGRITSMSENFGIAKKFAKNNQTNAIVELLPGAKGSFSFVGFLVQQYTMWKQKDPVDFEEQDGEWRQGSAEREAEWFVSGNTDFEFLEMEELDGIIIYKIKAV